MRKFGLIGYPLQHSFSKKHFSEKFKRLNLHDCIYENFELAEIGEISSLLEQEENLEGFNVTIPHKESIIRYCERLDEHAKAIQAVNVVKIMNGKLSGYNSDFEGFRRAIENWIPDTDIKALILGTGGASKAISYALERLNIDHQFVSRTPKNDSFSYAYLNEQGELLESYRLIVNTTPLGTFPNVEGYPDLPYQHLTSKHYLYDLVYNPPTTAFMKKGLEKRAKVMNGQEMLEIQAEMAWEIWNSDGV
ncbi:MAG: shikimate dehydrogenase [Bacteroidota bacterium]